MKMRCFSKKYIDLVIQKVVRTLISVKFWVIVATYALAYYVVGIAAENKAWELVATALNFVLAIVGIVIVMREGFQEGPLKEQTDDDKPKEE